jgi:hypothetical protein
MLKVKPVSEKEVIAEFVLSEFYQWEYHRDRHQFERLVYEPDFNSNFENEIRRKLLFRRRANVWHELPADTDWWQVQLEPQDISRIRMFTRGHWPKLTKPDRCAADFVERIRSNRLPRRAHKHLPKIQSMAYRLQSSPEKSTVILVGVDEQKPTTIIEGNHRITAALLLSREVLDSRLRFLVGFSSSMENCVFYENVFPNIIRYAWHRLARRFRPAHLELPPVSPLGSPVRGRDPGLQTDTNVAP